MEQAPEDEDRMWQQLLEKAIERGGREICRDTHHARVRNLKQDLLGKLDYMSNVWSIRLKNVPRRSWTEYRAETGR